MREGLITRIGRWIDYKWDTKATWLELQAQESQCSARHCGALEAIAAAESTARGQWNNLEDRQIKGHLALKTSVAELSMTMETLKSMVSAGPSITEKEFADFKTRLEKIELYSGMTRKVDPTKPPVAKSAFQM